MNIRFIPMEKSHLDEVLEIESQSFPTPWSRSSFTHEITGNDFACYFAAMEGGKVVGYAGMWIILDEGHITTIAVHPSRRRCRIGKSLMNMLINEAKSRGCVRMTLEVRPSNPGAIDLYEKLGFVSFGVRPGYYSDTGEDAVIMWKELYPETT
ncbi:MAG TPA: ribosomal protein S18-alanine N-acetyltransferase [Desulfobacteria bacterium]|nr:ribosomal protein S18-alanine N-acetyltransferase [Desulfobacteria bacterium]